MSRRVQYREDLDTMHCGHCGEQNCADHWKMYFHSQCHITSPTWVMYNRTTGTLLITCAECGEEIAEIAVDRQGRIEFVATEPMVIEGAVRLPPDGMKPYKLGDELDDGPDRWTRYNLCPRCGGAVTIRCKCRHGDSSCAQGHRWHIEWIGDKGIVRMGEWDHGQVS